MIVINKKIIDNCVYRHADSKKAMNKFVEKLMSAKCNNHAELLRLFPYADFAGNDRYVFDVRGNNYRIVCLIVFAGGTAMVRFAGSHAEYDKIDAKTI